MADACHLASYVEVYQAQAVLYVIFLENLKRLEQFARCEAELACIAAALFPLAAALRGKLDADAYVGAHAKALANLCNPLQLVELLHHKENAAAHLLCQQGKLNVAVVLVAVADYERVAVGVHCNHGVKLGLRAGLKANVVALSVACDFLYHRAHLVHLDGVDYEILALVVVLLCRNLETARNLLYAVVKNVGETYKHWCSHVAQLQFIH